MRQPVLCVNGFPSLITTQLLEKLAYRIVHTSTPRSISDCLIRFVIRCRVLSEGGSQLTNWVGV